MRRAEQGNRDQRDDGDDHAIAEGADRAQPAAALLVLDHLQRGGLPVRYIVGQSALALDQRRAT